MGGSEYYFSKVNGKWQCQECAQTYHNIPSTLPLKLPGICQTCGTEVHALHAKTLELRKSMTKSDVQKSAKPVRKKAPHFQKEKYGTKAQNEIYEANRKAVELAAAECGNLKCIELKGRVLDWRARSDELEKRGIARDRELMSARRMIAALGKQLAELKSASDALVTENERLYTKLNQAGQLGEKTLPPGAEAAQNAKPADKDSEDEAYRELQELLIDMGESFEQACKLIVAAIHTSDSDKLKDTMIGFLERHPPE
jgi:regulator of replication initiation timing